MTIRHQDSCLSITHQDQNWPKETTFLAKWSGNSWYLKNTLIRAKIILYTKISNPKLFYISLKIYYKMITSLKSFSKINLNHQVTFYPEISQKYNTKYPLVTAENKITSYIYQSILSWSFNWSQSVPLLHLIIFHTIILFLFHINTVVNYLGTSWGKIQGSEIKKSQVNGIAKFPMVFSD